jgi:hypothetical protein
MSVSTAPGAMANARMPCGRPSSAMAFVNRLIHALHAP